MDYDSWLTRTPDDCEEPSYEDFEFANAKDWLHEVIKAVYITGDIESLEDSLGELSAYFDVRLPKLEPVLKFDVVEGMRREIQSMRDKLESI